MYVYIHVHIHTYEFTYTYVYIYMYIYIYIHMFEYIYIQVYIYTYGYIYIYIYIFSMNARISRWNDPRGNPNITSFLQKSSARIGHTHTHTHKRKHTHTHTHFHMSSSQIARNLEGRIGLAYNGTLPKSTQECVKRTLFRGGPPNVKNPWNFQSRTNYYVPTQAQSEDLTFPEYYFEPTHHLMGWTNIIFTFYYTRVRPQCDYSILGRFLRVLFWTHSPSDRVD